MFNDYHIRCRNDIKQTIIVFCNNNLFEVTDVAANDDYIDIADDVVGAIADGFESTIAIAINKFIYFLI